MSSFPGTPRDEENYYAAPRGEIGGDASVGGDLAEAEAIRRRYLGHEASVKSVGSLHYLGAIFGTIAFFVFLYNLITLARHGGANGMAGASGIVVVLLGLYSAINFALGRGLTRLQPWARWVDIVLTVLGIVTNIAQWALIGVGPANARNAPGYQTGVILGMGIGLAIPCYILYLLGSAKGSMVFSREYREIIALTPHIRYRTSCLVKFAIGLFLAVILMAVVGGVIGLMARR